MKLTIELKDDKFEFNWNIGEEKQGGQCPMNVSTMKLFVNLCDNLHAFMLNDLNEKIRNIGARAWVETHLDDYKDMLKKTKS